MSKKRLLIIQYAGDYREAFLRLFQGGEETYYAQKQSVDAVAKIGKQIEEIAVLCCLTPEPYNELLNSGSPTCFSSTNFPSKPIVLFSAVLVLYRKSFDRFVVALQCHKYQL